MMSISPKIKIVALILLFWAWPGVARHEQINKTIRFYSEIAPPYFFVNEDGEAQGAMVDLANALFVEAELDATIEQLPWARAYYEATHSANSVLMLVLKTPQRQTQLQWLGLVHVAKASLIRLSHRKNIQIDSLEQAKQWRVATVRGYGSATYLQNHGFSQEKNLTLVSTTEQLWSLLYLERVDLVLTNAVSGAHEARNAGLDPSKIEPIYDIDELSLSLQMATGLNTDKEVVIRLTEALKTLKENGVYERILRKWELWES